jgi:Fic family protein
VDLRVVGAPDKFLEKLQQAGRLDLGDFMAFELAPDAQHPEITSEAIRYDGQRFRAVCKLAGKLYGQPFGVDVGVGDPMIAEPDVLVADDLLAFAGIAPPALRVYPVETHIAEKLHAYTMPRPRPNSRVKDLPDIALLASAKEIDGARLRGALEQTFDFRATHALPLSLPQPMAGWAAPYAAMAREDGLRWGTVEQVWGAGRAFLDPVLGGAENRRWDPKSWTWQVGVSAPTRAPLNAPTPMPLETPYRIEPCFPSTLNAELRDVTAEIARIAGKLGEEQHPIVRASLADIVRVVNAQYSNAIEGHHVAPHDIQRALAAELDGDEERRDLQLEAVAHIRVQREVDALCERGVYGEPASVERLRWLHREFYQGAPARSLRLPHEGGEYELEPGAFRTEPRHDVSVGRHVPPSSARVADFMDYFAAKYRLEALGTSSRIVAMAAAHHRLNYIHPFADGNGRVSRLMSHAMAHAAGIGAHGLWSIARGLARGLSAPSEYKAMMDAADAPRASSLDGRGNLSEAALVAFVTWFCRVALDQLMFMSGLFAFDALSARLTVYVQRTLALGEDADALAQEVLRRGEVARGEAARITGRPERSARVVLGKLMDAGLLRSETPKGAVRLRFGVESAAELFPRLFVPG